MALRVVVPLVITRNEDGSDRYLYEGAIVPDFVSDDEVKRLVEGEFVEKESASAPKRAASAPSN